MIVGGSAAPRIDDRGLQERHGLTIVHAWGMTETSPGRLRRRLPARSRRAAERRSTTTAPGGRAARRSSRSGPATTMASCPGTARRWASSKCGARGSPAVLHTRIRAGDVAPTTAGFRTGDIVDDRSARLHPDQDRAKDVIKSGGEWISSVDLENLLMAHPAVAEAAVIAVPDAKWGERPLAAVVLAEAAAPSPTNCASFLAREFAKWWLPDRFEFVDEIPKTSRGSSGRPRCARCSSLRCRSDAA